LYVSGSYAWLFSATPSHRFTFTAPKGKVALRGMQGQPQQRESSLMPRLEENFREHADV
jgi:hypothetical protein